MLRTVVFLAAVVVALGACAGGPPGSVCVAVPYAGPNQPYLALVYPIPGASSVPDALADIVVAGPSKLESNGVQFILHSDHPTSSVNLGTPTAPPSPLPSPLASYPPYAVLSGVPLPKLRAKTTYTILYAQTEPSELGCSPGPPIIGLKALGAFTTE